jgi:hypothetical protein
MTHSSVSIAMRRIDMKNKIILKWLLILGCMALILGLGVLKTRISLAGSDTPTPNPHQLEVLNMIHDAQFALTGMPENSQIYERKLSNAVGLATEMALNIGKPRKTRPAWTPVPTQIFPTWETGMSEGDPAHIGDDIENTWSGGFGGQNYQVSAGSLAGDPDQGIVDVWVISQNFTQRRFARYPTPLKSGSARIQSWEGTRLTLTTKGGDTLYFEVTAQQFVSSMREVAPTTTPLLDEYPTFAPTYAIDPFYTPYP